MSITWSVEFDHTDEVANDIRTTAGQLVQRALEQAAEMAIGLAPVLTGDLQASIHWEMTSETEGYLVVDAYYAVYVEYGTTFMDAQPFFTPAMMYIVQLFPELAVQSYSSLQWSAPI